MKSILAIIATLAYISLPAVIMGSIQLPNAPIKGGILYDSPDTVCSYVERNPGFVQIVCTEVTHVR
jgi:hypothetical protein